MNFANVNWLAVFIAVFLNLLLGYLWFGPLFGKSWRREQDQIKLKTGFGINGFGFLLLFSITSAFALWELLPLSPISKASTVWWLWFTFSALPNIFLYEIGKKNFKSFSNENVFFWFALSLTTLVFSIAGR